MNGWEILNQGGGIAAELLAADRDAAPAGKTNLWPFINEVEFNAQLDRLRTQ